MKKLDEKVLYAGKWIQLNEMTFASDAGSSYKWEIVRRKNNARGVVVVAEMLPSHRIVFLRQYRQPLENYIIGFPAGLAESDNLEEEALRELQEETGFYGRVLDVGPLIRSNPGLMDDGAYVVKAVIDETDPRNAKPQQKLEDSEEIEVFLIPKQEARAFILGRIALGDDVGMGVWYRFGFEPETEK